MRPVDCLYVNSGGADDFVGGSVVDPTVVERAMDGVGGVIIGHMLPNKPDAYDDPVSPLDVNLKLENLGYEMFYLAAGPHAHDWVDVAYTESRLGWQPDYRFTGFPWMSALLKKKPHYLAGFHPPANLIFVLEISDEKILLSAQSRVNHLGEI